MTAIKSAVRSPILYWTESGLCSNRKRVMATLKKNKSIYFIINTIITILDGVHV